MRYSDRRGLKEGQTGESNVDLFLISSKKCGMMQEVLLFSCFLVSVVGKAESNANLVVCCWYSYFDEEERSTNIFLCRFLFMDFVFGNQRTSN